MTEKAIESQARRRQRKIWRDHSDVGFLEGSLGIHAGTQEILDGTDHHYSRAAVNTHRIRRRIGHRAVHLYIVLVG